MLALNAGSSLLDPATCSWRTQSRRLPHRALLLSKKNRLPVLSIYNVRPLPRPLRLFPRLPFSFTTFNRDLIQSEALSTTGVLNYFTGKTVWYCRSISIKKSVGPICQTRGDPEGSGYGALLLGETENAGRAFIRIDLTHPDRNAPRLELCPLRAVNGPRSALPWNLEQRILLKI